MAAAALRGAIPERTGGRAGRAGGRPTSRPLGRAERACDVRRNRNGGWGTLPPRPEPSCAIFARPGMDRSLEPAAVSIAVRRNLARVRERIGRAAERAGRDRGSVVLLPITKYGDAEHVRALLDLGERDLGENRVDRILELEAAFPERARWHMVGHLQRNKARKVAGALATLGSLDGLETARLLDRRRAELGQAPLDVYLEVNVAVEPQKSGVAPDAAAALAGELAALRSLVLRGLMAMPPEAADPEASRPFFRRLRSLLPGVSLAYGRPVAGLSMGTTQDLEVAVEEGATVVRVGRALLEDVHHGGV